MPPLALPLTVPVAPPRHSPVTPRYTPAGPGASAVIAPPGAPHTAQRTDIQALRGFAVLVVVLYHVQLGRVHAGFLGVDVFFVISGFLITTLVARGIQRGTFSLRDFYGRRARRLLPAAYLTYLATAVLAPLVLTQRELRDLGAQVLGALTFSGNFVLWQQTGYFAGAADLKPLLHLWSLAVEEQYYVLLPATLLLTRGRWLPTVGVLFAASAAAYLSGVLGPSATFYLLPARAWELLTGSLGALWILAGRPARAAGDRALGLLFVPALAYLAVVVFLRLGDAAVRWHTLAVCAATLVVILRQSAAFGAPPPVRALARVGDVSYSLYLVHWPIVAFLNNAWAGAEAPPRAVRLLVLGLCGACAIALHRWVEDPIRRSTARVTPRLTFAALAATGLLAAITPLGLARARHTTDFLALAAPNYGLSTACEYTTPFAPKPACMTSATPDLLLWGDSFAMHLAPGLARVWDGRGIVQATRSECGPLLGLASIPRVPSAVRAGEMNDAAWAGRCLAFNDAVAAYARRSRTVRTVVLASPWWSYLQADHRHVSPLGSGVRVESTTVAGAAAALRRTIDTLHAAGKQVLLVAPPPSTGRDWSGCVERQVRHLVTLGGTGSCAIDRAAYLAARAPVLDFLGAVAESAHVAVLRFDPWLCSGATCATTLDGTALYRDGAHLSYAGSALLARRMHLGAQVHALAR